MTNRRSATGAEALFGAAFTYALTGILVREMAPMWGDNAQGAARFMLVVVILLGYRLIRKRKLVISRRHIYLALALGVLFGSVVLFFNAAINQTTIANTLFVFYAANMTTSFLLGTLLLREKVPLSKIIAIILALLGLSVYSHALLAGSLGLLYAIGAGIFDGSSNVLRKKLSGADRSSVIVIQYAAGTVFAVLVTLLSGQEILRHVSTFGIFITIFFALVLIVGSNLMLYGFQHFDVNVGSVIMSTELVFATVLAYILFKEVPATHELLGGVLIFAGSIVGSGALDKFKR